MPPPLPPPPPPQFASSAPRRTEPPDATPFFKHLRQSQVRHILVAGETDDFDPHVLRSWEAEGFKVTYVALCESTPEQSFWRLRNVADKMLGVSDKYVIVAFQDAASAVLTSATHSVPRLAAVIAYYPSAIPDPLRTTYPPDLHVLMHLNLPSIGVERTAEVLGIQGKKRIVSKTIPGGIGIGRQLQLDPRRKPAQIVSSNVVSYVYPGCESGFAESDLDEYNQDAEELAWSRSLRVAKTAFGLAHGDDVEAVRDAYLDRAKMGDLEDQETTLTLNGDVVDDEVVDDFYSTVFGDALRGASTILISRTVGIDRVVDEIEFHFSHSADLNWLLPKTPPTGAGICFTLVCICKIRGDAVESESVCWNQSDVQEQIRQSTKSARRRGSVKHSKNGTRARNMQSKQAARVAQSQADEQNLVHLTIHPGD